MTDKQVQLLQVTSHNGTDPSLNNDDPIPPNLLNSCHKNSGPLKLPPMIKHDEKDLSDKNNLIPNAWQDEEEEHKEDMIIHSRLSKSCMTLSRSRNILNQLPLSPNDRKLARSWKIKVWMTLFRFFSTTSFHGLPYIAGSQRSLIRLVFWISALFISLSLMTVAVVLVTRRYVNQNTVLSSKQHFHKTLPFPAVTICNKNLNRRSVAVDSGIDLDQLTVFFNIYFSDNPYLADESFDVNVFFENYLQLFAQEDSVFYYNNSGHQLKDMLFDCQYAGQDHCQLHNFTQRTSTEGNCYTFNSGHAGAILLTNNSGRSFGLELILNAEEYEYFQAESDSVGFNVFIHDPDHFPHYRPSGGFSASSGQLTQVALHRIDSKFLTESQGGQCDDVTLNYFNSYSRESCIAECVTNFVMRQCECKLQFMPGPAKVCNLTDDCQYNATMKIAEGLTACDCPIACESTSYQTTLSYAKFPAAHFVRLLNVPRLVDQLPWPDFVINSTVDDNGMPYQYLNANFTESFITNNFAKILIYYDTLASTTMEEGLEYSTEQFLIDFGGYIGLFTGAGFLTIFELFELCYNFLSPVEEYS